nr:MAG TPA: hypothetical protein [Caudoviricetes sp.]
MPPPSIFELFHRFAICTYLHRKLRTSYILATKNPVTIAITRFLFLINYKHIKSQSNFRTKNTRTTIKIHNKNNFFELFVRCSICTYLRRKLQILRKPSGSL